MKKIFIVTVSCLLVTGSFAQTTTQKLQKAWQQFEADPQLKHAISSLYVIDAKTGKVVFDKNSKVGLAPASTQKIITATTAFELLGKDYRYKTLFMWGTHNGLYVLGNGDPTFGSWRYQNTIDTTIFKPVIESFKKKGKPQIDRFVILDNELLKNVPSGWIYEDIANYYGAAPKKLNWHENQFDIVFLPGKEEGYATQIDTSATFSWNQFINQCKTGKAGSGDNAYIYFMPGERKSVIEGTIPAGVKRFSISASDNTPDLTFSLSFLDYASSNNFIKDDERSVYTLPPANPVYSSRKDTIYTHSSPPSTPSSIGSSKKASTSTAKR